MKKWLILLLVLSFVAQAQHKVNFHEGKLADVLKTAQAEKKPILFMGYATWCAHCNKMKAEVMADSLVADFCNKTFVCAWQDMESGEGIDIRKNYGVKAFPAFLFLDAKGVLLYSATGEFTAANFIKECQNALDPKKQFPYLKSQFEADANNADNCLAYVMALRKSNLDAEEPAKKYLASQTESQLISATNWKIIANGIRDINSREFQFVLRKQPEFAAVSSPKRVERKIINIVQEWLNPYVEAKDTTNYFRNRIAADKIGLAKTDSLIFDYDIKILESTKNWKAYRKVTAAGAPKFAWNNATQLKDIAKVYMNNITDIKALDDAIAWTKRALELKDTYDGYIIVSRLYFYKGDKKSAKEWAEKAKALAVSLQFDTKQADEILNQIK